MAESLTHRERLLRSGRGESVDRVPLSPPISFDPLVWEQHQGQPPRAADDPLWAEVAAVCAQSCDCLLGVPGVGMLFDRRFLLTPAQYIERLPEEPIGEWLVTRHIIHTPKGDLTTTDCRKPGTATSWYTEPLVKTVEDAKALLSVPYEFIPPDLTAAREFSERVGDRALTEIHVSTPLVSVSRVMRFDRFLLWCAAERDLIHQLMSTMAERIRCGLEYVLQAGLGPVVWFGGSEQATPPMMGPEMYDDFVVRYDAPLMDLVHSYGGLVHVHCHGKVRCILDRLVDMGIDMLDPLEPPPDGDITMAEAKRATARRITLLGNIEFRELEFSSPARIRELVRTAILDGGPERVHLYPSATPIEKITPRYRDNALAYLEAGLEFGAMN
ncbi:MAG: uroporphyrinogen decarboxylase family protein [Candidatus Zipacnadales bacterium]